MSQATEIPSLRDYVSALNPAQERHLRLVIHRDTSLPPLAADERVSPAARVRRLGFAASGSGPADLAARADDYLDGFAG
jgi:hypothetical protein